MALAPICSKFRPCRPPKTSLRHTNHWTKQRSTGNPVIFRLGCTALSSQRLLHTSRCMYNKHDGFTAPSPSAVGFNNYDEECKRFKGLRKPEYYNFATDVIDEWAKLDHTRNGLPAFWWVGEDGSEVKLSFSDLSTNSKRVANILRSHCKLEVGEKFLIILPKVPPWWWIYLAAIRSGLILIPGTTQLTAKDIRLRLEKSEVRCVIVDPINADKVDQVVDEFPGLLKSRLLVGGSGKRSGWLNFEELYNNASPDFQDIKTKSDDISTIFFTSGTTGLPKMCAHTHTSYPLGHAISGKYWMDLTDKDIVWALSDTGWAKAAWGNVFCPWIYGACVFVHSEPKFDPIQTLKILEKYPISVFCSPPTGYRFMIQERLNKFNFYNARHCISAGEPLNPEVTQEWFEGTNRTIREGYGQSETVLLSATYRCIPNKPGSMGRPPPGMDVQIIDEDAQVVGDNIEGDIALRVKPQRPVGLFQSYVDDPRKTASVYNGDFYLTGDRAYRDDEGYLWFVARSDDVILSSGYRIGPFEVESSLIEHHAVAESAVVSSPDQLRGEVVKAFVVLTDKYKGSDVTGLTKELQDHVKTHTAPYKYPRLIEFVDSLPKTVSGKIRRVELRKKEWNRGN